MKLVDLSNPRHQQILIEEIARAKRIIAERDFDANNNGYPDETENPDFGKKTYIGKEILNHPDFVNLPETRSDVDWNNRPQVFLPALDTVDARQQIFAKSDLLGSEVQGPKMVHKFSGYLKEFEHRFNEKPIFIDVDHKYLGKIIDIQNPKFVAWREQGLAAKGAYMDAARKRGWKYHD